MRVLNYSKLQHIPTNAVYIGRAMKGIEASKFYNPFKMHNESMRHEVCVKYKEHLWKQIKSGEVTVQDLLELDGKDLVCWCAPRECHGDTLLKAVAWAKTQAG